MDEFGHRNEINDVEQSASHPKSHEVSKDVAERNNSELEDSGKNDSGKTEKMQDSQRDNPKIENAEKQPDNSELKEPKEDSHHPSSSEIDNSKQQLPESDVKSENDQKSKQEHIPEHNFNSEPLPEAKNDKPEDKKEALDNPQSKSNEVEKASGEKDTPAQSSELSDNNETSANDIGKSNAKEVNDPIEIKRDENDTFAPKRTSELPDTYNEGSDNKGDIAGKTNNNDIESGDYRKPESDKPLSEPEDSEKSSLREDKNYPDDLSDDEIKQLDENTAPTELIDTTNDKDHPYVDEDGNKKTWRENQSPLVNQEDSNGKYNPDAWGQEDIPKGTKLYQITGEDGKQSPYYFDEDTANKCRDKDGRIDPNAVKNYLQIDDPNNSKNTIREYYVPEDMKNVPEGRTTENPKYGEGGGKQYYIASQDDRNKLEPLKEDNSDNFAKNCPIEGNDGHWDGERGNSKWNPDKEYIPQKANPENKSWGEILKDNNIDGITFNEGNPNFNDISKGNVKINDFSDKRSDNFDKADAELAKQRGCKPEDVEAWRKDPAHKYTWHECPDMQTMQKVPSIVHNNVSHRGGISAAKSLQ